MKTNNAFKEAGVQSLLMSLWEVDDEATQVLMTAFYQNLANGYSKYESLKSAQDKVRNSNFIRNGKKSVEMTRIFGQHLF